MDAFAIRAMGLALRTGRKVDFVSSVALVLTAAWLTFVVARVAPSAGAAATAALAASVVAGLVQGAYASRVAFDAELLVGLAGRMEGVAREQADASSRSVLDDALRSIGAPADVLDRGWELRWRGARRLLALQVAALAVQLALAFGAGGLAITHTP